MPIQATPLPADALLGRYAGSDAFTDCYMTEIDGTVSAASFIETFYTGRVFKLERFLIKLLQSRASSDVDALKLAIGETGSFAAWTVEARAPTQLLMRDLSGRTRSWLMVCPAGSPDVVRTRLYFGSAVVPIVDAATGAKRMGFLFKALLGFHRVYSRVLLGEAQRRLARAAR